jgi:hypothetical protein
MAKAEIDGAAMAQTEVLRRVLAEPMHRSAVADLLFLEAWERNPSANAGVTLRVSQIRRANPALAAEIRDEITTRQAASLLRRMAPRVAANINMSRN